MARVFLSHSSRDKDEAAELKAWLDGQGFATTFLDFDNHSGIPVGADWERTLYEQIQRSQALLILQTPNWSSSRWCFAEFAQARALGKPVFQVVENDESAAEKPIAADLQRLDLREDRLAGLEQLRRELERVALQDQGGFPWPPPSDPGRAPFPGLLMFEEEDAPVFFGRDNDWRTVIERLRTQRCHGGTRLLVIQGSSGSGKSSMLRAGVLPRLKHGGREWLVLPVLRPRARPLESLAQTLALALQRPEAWRELHQQLLNTMDGKGLEGLVAGWAADLRLAAQTPDAQLLLPIDQGEELFTVAEATERERFVGVLSTLLDSTLPLQAVMTIRADAMGSLQALPQLVNRFEALPLGPLSLERYREIIEGPARVAGLKAEPAFVERAIHDTATEDALPLLAFALRQLHDSFGADGVLSLSDYQALGEPSAGLSPLENAVKQAADGVLRAKQPDKATLKALREAFVPAMVRISEQGSYARRAADWDTLPEAARPLLKALVTARLLVQRQDQGQTSKVEVAHEALLRVWPMLRSWLDESRDFLLGSQQLEEDYSQWMAAESADKNKALLSGLKLIRARAWLASRPEQISPNIRTYIETSHRRQQAQKNLMAIIISGLFIAVSGAACLAFIQLKRAEEANRVSDRRMQILDAIFPDLGLDDETQKSDNLSAKLSIMVSSIFPPEESDNIIDWGPKYLANKSDCLNSKASDEMCTRNPDGYNSDGIRNDIPYLASMTSVLFKSVTEKKFSTVEGIADKIEFNFAGSKNNITGDQGLIPEHLWTLLSGKQRQEITKKIGALWPIGEGQYTNYFQVARRPLDSSLNREVIFLKLVNSGFCGSRGCTSPVFGFLRVGESLRLVYVEILTGRLSLLSTGRGLMPQLLSNHQTQSGILNQHPRLRRYIFTSECNCYMPYIQANLNATARGGEVNQKIPALSR